MANTFVGNPDEGVSWANGLTTVLLARIAVASAELYTAPWEYEFARWMATRDQNRYPPGFVGYDLAELPWGEPAVFADRKRFVIEAVVHAASHEVAYRLPYYPNPSHEDAHRECLRQYALLVHHFHRPDPVAVEWRYLYRPTEFMCVHHRMFCHEDGCMVCPDVVADDPPATPALSRIRSFLWRWWP